VNVPGQLNASYTFIPTPPIDQGTIQISPSSTSDPKCSTASDQVFLDASTTGSAFTVSNGYSALVPTGSHQVKLASATSIPVANQSGYCTSAIDNSNVTVTKDQTITVNATYQYHPNTTNMSCSVVSSTVTAQADWGPGTGIVNTFEIKVNLKNFPQNSSGKILVDSSFTMKNNFLQNFWGNFNITSSSFKDNVGSFKGELWSNQLPATISGFINNTVPLKVGDNPMNSIVINGVTCQ
jgi:hypothetical protein